MGKFWLDNKKKKKFTPGRHYLYKNRQGSLSAAVRPALDGIPTPPTTDV